MANRRAIVRRRAAVRNIRKITRTMQMIATARFQSALNRAQQTRPYTDKLAELVADLGEMSGDYVHPLMESHEQDAERQRSALMVITSNRGLCGAYNANVLRQAMKHIDAQRKAKVETEVTMVGTKGASAFRFRGRPMHEQVTHIDDRPRYEEVEPLAEELLERFLAGEVSSVHVAYMRFYSASKQVPEVTQLLPLAQELVGEEREEEPATTRSPYEIRPSAEELLDRLLPATVRMRLYQSFVDAAVSEHIARMTAMKAATEAAEEMIGDLTRQYNRARQSHITMELLDIVGGAAALQ